MDWFRNPKLVIGVAGVMALLAGLLVFLHFSNAGASERKAPPPVVMIVRATRDIGPGTLVTADMLTSVPLPQGKSSEGVILEESAAVGRVVLAPISAGDAVRIANLASASAALGPAYTLSPSQRAVTMALPPPAALAGFLKPGDHVDVLATFIRGDDAITRTILQDVLVIAVGMETERTAPPPPGDKSAAASQANFNTTAPVTVAVSLPDAERLVMADTQGKVRLVLRSASNGGAFQLPAKGARQSDVSGLIPAANAATAPVKSTLPATAAAPLQPTVPGQPTAVRVSPAVGASPGASPSQPVRATDTITVLRGTTVEQVPVARLKDRPPSSKPEAAPGGRGTGTLATPLALQPPDAFPDSPERMSEPR